MNLRTIPRAAVTGSLWAARTPAEAAARLLPGNGSGPAANAQLAIDRVDAGARALAGTILRDPALREDARRRREALLERGKAVRLREQADQRTARARETEEERHTKAAGRRRRADAQAKDRRRQANSRKDREQTQAGATATQRKRNSHKVEQQVEEKIDEQAPEARLDALQTQAEAQQEREAALKAQDEAERLGQAAARAKEERKQD